MEGFNNLSRSVKGRVTLITGASSGMGKATALVFAAEGAKVIATDIDEENVTQLAKEINSSGGECIGIALDVTDKNIIMHPSIQILVVDAQMPLNIYMEIILQY